MENDFFRQIAETVAAVKAANPERYNQPAYVPQPKPAPTPRPAAVIRAELAAAQSRFDPAFERSDDHRFWRAQSALAVDIAGLESELAAAMWVAA